MLFRPATLVLLLALTPLAAEGQRRSTDADLPRDMPEDMRPPAGKCRIWMEGVPPQQQPAATDCQTALRLKPANGVVVFGPTRGRELEVRGFRTLPRPSRSDTVSRRTALPMPSRRGGAAARDTAGRDTVGRRLPPAPVPQPARTRTPGRPKPDSLSPAGPAPGERQS